jgi:hypothetical protein
MASLDWDEKYKTNLENEIIHLVKELNNTKDFVKKEKDFLLKDLAEFAEFNANEKAKISDEKAVDDKRRSISSKVLLDLYESASKKLEEANELKKQAEISSARSSEAMDKASALVRQAAIDLKTAREKAQENADKSENLDSREKIVVSSENKLAEDTSKFENHRKKEQGRIDEALVEISLARQSLKIMRDELDYQKSEFANEKSIEIARMKDERATLDSAWREFRAEKIKK